MINVINKYKFILVFSVYILGSLLLGEIHPFSRFPMYNQFPNWSYVFYLSDENYELIPSMKFNISGGWIGHTFYAICQDENILYGDNVESEEELEIVGRKMLDIILPKNQDELSIHKIIHLHKVSYFFEGSEIISSDKVMYARHLE
jgi:hypothetical protein